MQTSDYETSKVKCCFPYFGGKSKVAPIIWQGLGSISNYIEPFCGSLAVLLAAPKIPKIETVNDKDCFISNFWRAVSIDPAGVAKYADYPVHESDMHARHKWLVSSANSDFHKKMNSDPYFYDLKIAGWWVWGMGASIGDSWLKSKGLNALPCLSSAGGGIHGLTLNPLEWFEKLQTRLRRTRVCCGDWKRIATPSITYRNKGVGPKDITGVFLDPPYNLKNRDKVYREDTDVCNEVLEWAIENGNIPRMRIALCGYEGDYKLPDNWSSFSWKANGGFANLGSDRGKQNAKKEMIYFSPYCLKIS
jgi:DNA adenine methylase